MIALSVQHLNLHVCCMHMAFESMGCWMTDWCCKCKGVECPHVRLSRWTREGLEHPFKQNKNPMIALCDDCGVHAERHT